MQKAIASILLGILLSQSQVTTHDFSKNIQAICRIEFKNGKIEEGIITLGNPHKEMFFYHGFYLAESWYSDSSEVLLIMKDFVKLNFTGSGEVRYIENMTFDLPPNKYLNLNDSILVKTQEEKFRFHQRFKLYKNLPDHLHIFSNIVGIVKEETSEVIVNEIMTFELLRHPAEKWIELIKKKRGRFIDQNKRKYGEYSEPIWFHEIEISERELLRLKYRRVKE